MTNNPDSGIDALKNAGMDKNFVNSMYNKYGKYAGKLGMSQESLKSLINNIGNSLENKNNSGNVTRNNSQTKASNKFNPNKYPKV